MFLGTTKLIKVFSVLPVFILLSSGLKNGNLPCQRWKSVALDDGEIDGNGKTTYKGITYDAGEVFTDEDAPSNPGQSAKNLRGCPCLKNACVRKCCPHDEVYISNTGTGRKAVCVKRDGPDFYHHLVFYSYAVGHEPEKLLSDNSVTILTHELKEYCENKIMFPLEDDEFYLLNNGSLLKESRAHPPYELVTIDRYCVDIYNDRLTFLMCSVYKSSARTARPTALPFSDNLVLRLYPICMMTSLPFLTATCLLYFFVPELSNLVGKSLSSLTLSRIIFSGPLCWTMLFGDHLNDTLCVCIAGFLFWFFDRIHSTVFNTGKSNCDNN